MDGQARGAKAEVLIVEQNLPTRNPESSVSSGLMAARTQESASALRFPGEDGGQSLADMAQRDLDAALQLLADRAQYITGASGAAIALRRRGMNDMLCRASSGSNAPELGALLSTEYGLSGESVRTRQLLRCNDTETDQRVNREVCRELGISSVVVMPVVHDDEVLGVFELFSGKANAFTDRDLSAVERLTEMVETAVGLAQAADHLAEKLMVDELPSATMETASPVASADSPVAEPTPNGRETDDHILDPDDTLIVAASGVPDLEEIGLAAKASPDEEAKANDAAAGPVESAIATAAGSALPAEHTTQSGHAAPASPTPAPAAKRLFWSAALQAGTDKKAADPQPQGATIAHAAHNCAVCGFPVSPERSLCVECEERKWRGQLKPPGARSGAAPARALEPSAVAPPPAEAAGAMVENVRDSQTASGTESVLKSETEPESPNLAPTSGLSIPAGPAADSAQVVQAVVAAAEAAGETAVAAESSSTPELFASTMEPKASWLSANKFVIGALLLVAAIAVATVLHFSSH